MCMYMYKASSLGLGDVYVLLKDETRISSDTTRLGCSGEVQATRVELSCRNRNYSFLKRTSNSPALGMASETWSQISV